jgi:hypothetical protein
MWQLVLIAPSRPPGGTVGCHPTPNGLMSRVTRALDGAEQLVGVAGSEPQATGAVARCAQKSELAAVSAPPYAATPARA